MRSGVAGLFKNFLWLDYFVNTGLGGVWLRIHDINAGGTDAWDYEVASLDERVPVSGDSADEQAFQPK
jgi:hypothetical protein